MKLVVDKDALLAAYRDTKTCERCSAAPATIVVTRIAPDFSEVRPKRYLCKTCYDSAGSLVCAG